MARWLHNFVLSHAKRESPRVEGVVEAEEEREGKSYGVRLRLGDRLLPPPDQPPLELTYQEVAEGKASFAWCEALAGRIRGLARELLDTQPGQPSKSA
ncbi:MAG: hypothetical protein HY726_15175 [Candidatus Rokubacteria bacterium]|nr:hypothetical protein [Candidatus Rokubacteria bacterium]